VTALGCPLKKDDQGLRSTTIGPLAPGVHEVKIDVDGYAIIILNIVRDLSRRLRAIDEMFAAAFH
jgi:hypothetical protein